MKTSTKILTLVATLSSAVVAAQELMPSGFGQSGFMDDYTILTKIDDGTADYRYLAEGAVDRIAKFDAVMVDEPEIFIAADSPYRGVKPKQLDALGEAIRNGIMGAISEEFEVVEAPGENVMYMRLALTDLRLNKRKRGLLGYTPIGLVGGTVKGAASTDIAAKADLQDVMLEIEVYDSSTEELLVAIVDHRGEGKADPSSWEELEAMASAYGQLVRCRLDNARYTEAARVDCFALDR